MSSERFEIGLHPYLKAIRPIMILRDIENGVEWMSRICFSVDEFITFFEVREKLHKILEMFKDIEK